MFTPSASRHRLRRPSQRVCQPGEPSPLRPRCPPGAAKARYTARTVSKGAAALVAQYPQVAGFSRVSPPQPRPRPRKRRAAVCNCSFSASRPVFRALWKASISQQLAYYRAQTRAWAKSVTDWSQSSSHSRPGAASGPALPRPAPRCRTRAHLCPWPRPAAVGLARPEPG